MLGALQLHPGCWEGPAEGTCASRPTGSEGGAVRSSGTSKCGHPVGSTSGREEERRRALSPEWKEHRATSERK